MDTTIPFPAARAETSLTEALSDAERADAAAGSARIDALFAAHRERLFALAMRMTGQRADALDLLQDTFVRALRSPGRIPRTPGGAEAWLVRVLVNLARDRWRRQRVRGVPAEIAPSLAAAGSPERASLARLQVQRALASIPPRRRAIVILAEIEGLTSQEVGALLGMRPATVRWHLARARVAMLARLDAPAACPAGDAGVVTAGRDA